MTLELRDIEYFAVVAKHKSIGRAAEALDMSQSALSKSLRRLEQALRAKIVQRTTKGVELTAVGSALLAKINHLRLSMDDIYREADALSKGTAGHLRIGTAPSFEPHLAAACAALANECPNVMLTVVATEHLQFIENLRNGTLDLAVTTSTMEPADDLVEMHLFDEQYVVYASANHRLAKRKQLTLADLVHERWAMRHVTNPSWRRLCQAFGKAGLPPPRIGIDSSNISLRQHMVASTNMVAYASKEIAHNAAKQHAIVQWNLKELAARRRVGVVYRKDGYLLPAGRRFIEILKATAKQIAKGDC
jgi:DNA-binding transcriptional LysR family regulator